jgi:uncharacterized protein
MSNSLMNQLVKNKKTENPHPQPSTSSENLDSLDALRNAMQPTQLSSALSIDKQRQQQQLINAVDQHAGDTDTVKQRLRESLEQLQAALPTGRITTAVEETLRFIKAHETITGDLLLPEDISLLVTACKASTRIAQVTRQTNQGKSAERRAAVANAMDDLADLASLINR